MVSGSVKWFDEEKGLGFLQLASGGPDIFVHYSNILMDGHKVLHPGDRVEFDLLDGPKGPLAENVQLIWRNAYPKPRWYYQRYVNPPRRRYFDFFVEEAEDGNEVPAEATAATAELVEE